MKNKRIVTTIAKTFRHEMGMPFTESIKTAKIFCKAETEICQHFVYDWEFNRNALEDEYIFTGMMEYHGKVYKISNDIYKMAWKYRKQIQC
jgi:hypothetical protein